MTASNDPRHTGSFAEGERAPQSDVDSPAGHFSEGSERDHQALAGMTGSFSDGDLAMHAEHERTGSFGDVDCPVCRAKAEAAKA